MRSSKNRFVAVTRAFSFGLLAMYLFDPDIGRRRRSLLADKMRKTRHRLSDLAEVASRDAANRTQGLRTAMGARLSGERLASPRVIEERVRARIGRAVSSPGALQVQARDDGTVILAGPVLASEVGCLMRAARSVRGVKAVDDQLDVHDHPGNIPALQGARGPRSSTGHGMTENWPPSVRVLAAAVGASLAVVSLFRRGPMNLVGPVLGGALLMRAAANKSLKRAAGFSWTKSVHIDKEMFVAAPPERVFKFWRHQENFPQFMRNVQEVQAAGEDRWHWKVASPLGPVEWDAKIVEPEENRRLAWHTLPGTPVESEGRIDFEPEGEGTRLRVSMGYTPVAGALGHAAARLFGKDAKSEMDEDLMRVKSYLETGVAARRGRATKSGGGRSPLALTGDAVRDWRNFSGQLPPEVPFRPMDQLRLYDDGLCPSSEPHEIFELVRNSHTLAALLVWYRSRRLEITATSRQMGNVSQGADLASTWVAKQRSAYRGPVTS